MSLLIKSITHAEIKNQENELYQQLINPPDIIKYPSNIAKIHSILNFYLQFNVKIIIHSLNMVVFYHNN